jgi:hypothetical protein
VNVFWRLIVRMRAPGFDPGGQIILKEVHARAKACRAALGDEIAG